MRLMVRVMTATAVMAFLAMAIPASAQTLRVTASSTNLRARPATDAAIVVTLQQGAELDVIAQQGTWYLVRVRASGDEGFVHSLVVVAAATTGAPTAAPAPATSASATTPRVVQTGASSRATSFGVKGGFNFSNILLRCEAECLQDRRDLSDAPYSSHRGFVAGGFFTRPVSDLFGIQPEVLFTKKGARRETCVLSTCLRQTYELTYAEVPVLARISAPTPRGISPYLLAGPAIAFRTGATYKSEIDADFECAFCSNEADFSDEVNSIDFGLVIAGGIEWSKLLVEARYTRGLSELSTDTQRSDDPEVRNRAFTLMAGFRF